jgi:PAS domain S-box-containing protein
MRRARAPEFGPAHAATVLGWSLVAVALTTLAGWLFHLPALVQLVPWAATMKANTAVCFLLVGIAVIRRAHRDFLAYPIGLLLIAGATTLEAITGSNFRIDELLFRDPTSSYPGRMSLVTMGEFLVLGVALLFLHSNRPSRRQASRVLGIIVGLIAGLALLGYAYDTHAPLIQIRPHTELAIMTAVAFVIAAIAVQFAFPAEGVVRLFFAENSGGAMLRRMLPTGILIPLLLGYAVRTIQLHQNWEDGFAVALASALIIGCLVILICFNAMDLEKDDVERQETEQRFRLVADTAPVMIWMSGTDKLCTFFNEPWLQFTGRTMEVELGNGWSESVHPDDLKHCLSIYTSAFDRREPFQMQYRLRRHDGEYRWLLDTGVPRFDSKSGFAGYIGSCIDITDRKQAQEALAELEGRLIQAQEEERSHIARELHDDINQRIAALNWELCSLQPSLPDGQERRKKTLEGVIERLRGIGTDIQAISRRLHSSHLEYLGLASAAEALCRELRVKQEVDVEFTCYEVPRDLPKDISLCLYRVLQEGLQNAIKHSGVRTFKVELQREQESVRLTISDKGAGFDTHTAARSPGLGLISMRERTRIVRGQFTVDSEPGRGTTITCRVPLQTVPDKHTHDREELNV